MFSFAPVAVHTPYHFEVTENGRGYWIAKDKEGLIGGVFRTQKDALRFALFEAGGDSACVQVSSSAQSKTDCVRTELGRSNYAFFMTRPTNPSRKLTR
jgi:hypothetical protein